jgi:uncharacterized protein (TIGR02391 family)
MALRFKHRVDAFSTQQLTSIAKILADTTSGLTGSQIEHILRDCGMKDVNPDFTKWKRLYNAFVACQIDHQIGNHVVMFITRAMNPVQYTGSRDVFNSRRDELNAVLAFCGMEVGDDGKCRQASRASNLDEALARANRLKAALTSRNVHADVLQFCRAELLQQNYFHAVFEATKSIASKVRTLSGLANDGAELVQQAFGMGGGKMPLVAINTLATDTDKGEQRGFASLLTGLFGTIRNPLAHNPKVEWEMSEQDALDILTMASLIHRKLDRARRCVANP